MEELGSTKLPNPDVSDIQEYRRRLQPDNLPQPEEFSERAEYDDATLASFYIQQWSTPVSELSTSERILHDVGSEEKLKTIASDEFLRRHGATLNFAGERYIKALIKSGFREVQARALEATFRVHFVYQVGRKIQTVTHPGLRAIIQAIESEGDRTP